MQTTYVPKKGEIHRAWHVIDATDLVLGRLCTEVARHLSGKNKPQYTPFLDTGDHVIIVNARKIRLTGDKQAKKIYYWHTGYPGGIKSETAGRRLAKHPERIIQSGVKGMLPKSKLGRAMIKKLKVYAGAEHPHAAQAPVTLELGASS